MKYRVIYNIPAVNLDQKLSAALLDVPGKLQCVNRGERRRRAIEYCGGIDKVRTAVPGLNSDS